MPLSKVKQAEYMRGYRKRLQTVIPKFNIVIPNRFLLAHIRVYPEGFNPDSSYKKDYNLDPYINPLVRPSEPLSVIPKCHIGCSLIKIWPDGRYRCNLPHPGRLLGACVQPNQSRCDNPESIPK